MKLNILHDPAQGRGQPGWWGLGRTARWSRAPETARPRGGRSGTAPSVATGTRRPPAVWPLGARAQLSSRPCALSRCETTSRGSSGRERGQAAPPGRSPHASEAAGGRQQDGGASARGRWEQAGRPGRGAAAGARSEPARARGETRASSTRGWDAPRECKGCFPRRPSAGDSAAAGPTAALGRRVLQTPTGQPGARLRAGQRPVPTTAVAPPLPRGTGAERPHLLGTWAPS